MGENIIQDFVKSIIDYNPKIKSNAKLRDDYKLLAAYYTSKKAGKSVTVASLPDIMLTAKLIYNEIEARRECGTMEHNWNPENMKPAAKELFDRLQSDEDPPQNLAEHITEDILIVEKAVYLATADSTEIRLSLDEGPLASIVKAKLYKMFPDEIAQKLNVTHPVARSLNPVPLFDLVLKRHEIKPNGLLEPASPQKVFYNIPDLVEACFV